MIYDVINLVNWLFRNLLIRDFLRKRHVTKLMTWPTNLILQRVSPVQVEVNTMSESWKTYTSWFHPWKYWSLYYEWCQEIVIFSFEGISNLTLGCQNVSIEISTKFHEKIPSRSGVIRYSRSGKHTSPTFFRTKD